jgi:hypothetical protein
VIEVKNRMSTRNMSSSPQLYDIIQLVVYMKMCGAVTGDLVQQCVGDFKAQGGGGRTGSDAGGAGGAGLVSGAGGAAGGGAKRPADATSITVSRVELAGMHGDSWDNFVIPRLHAFVEMISSFRRNTSQRLAFLSGTEEERRRVAFSLCPFLERPQRS